LTEKSDLFKHLKALHVNVNFEKGTCVQVKSSLFRKSFYCYELSLKSQPKYFYCSTDRTTT